MRVFPGTAVAALLGVGIAFAEGGINPLAQPPDAMAGVAVPGKLDVVDCGGVPHYAFAGEAEDYFPGEGLESEAELYEEAVLDAKTRLYDILSGGDVTRRVELSGLFVARHWAEGPMRRVVCVVPVDAVHVTGGIPAESLPPLEASPLGKEVLEMDETSHTIPTESQTPTNL